MQDSHFDLLLHFNFAFNVWGILRTLAGIGEIANISNAERQTPNAERQKFWTDRSVVWILIFLEKFEKISSADFIAKNLKKISSAEFIDADFIEKKFALLISLKKISTVDFIEKNFSNPKPQNDRPVVFKRRTPIFTDRPVVPFFVSY